MIHPRVIRNRESQLIIVPDQVGLVARSMNNCLVGYSGQCHPWAGELSNETSWHKSVRGTQKATSSMVYRSVPA